MSLTLHRSTRVGSGTSYQVGSSHLCVVRNPDGWRFVSTFAWPEHADFNMQHTDLFESVFSTRRCALEYLEARLDGQPLPAAYGMYPKRYMLRLPNGDYLVTVAGAKRPRYLRLRRRARDWELDGVKLRSFPTLRAARHYLWMAHRPPGSLGSSS